eukprot:g345.t1
MKTNRVLMDSNGASPTTRSKRKRGSMTKVGDKSSNSSSDNASLSTISNDSVESKGSSLKENMEGLQKTHEDLSAKKNKKKKTKLTQKTLFPMRTTKPVVEEKVTTEQPSKQSRTPPQSVEDKEAMKKGQEDPINQNQETTEVTPLENKSKTDDDGEEWVDDEDAKFKASILAKAQRAHKSQSQKRVELENLLQKAQVYSGFIDNKLAQELPKWKAPKSLTGGEEKLTLRPYQVEGVNWLTSLNFNGHSAILADEMGLGKTVQVISLIAELYDKGLRQPNLVVAPLSTLHNWVNEARRWTTFDAVLYHGSRHERKDFRILLGLERGRLSGKTEPEKLAYLQNARKGVAKLSGNRGGCPWNTNKFPVLVTSYDILMRDASFFRKINWNVLTVDEGHRLKNKDCRLMRILKEFRSNMRLLLSGTPLQNNLAELWSLLNFIMPDIFGDLSFFLSWFGWDTRNDSKMTEQIRKDQQETSIVDKLHRILRPFMMRRLKKDVEKHLPLKKEIVVYASLSESQDGLYEKIENDMRGLWQKMRSKGSHQKVLSNRIMQLRKCCNHPMLFTDIDLALQNSKEADDNQNSNTTSAAPSETDLNLVPVPMPFMAHTDESIVTMSGKMILLDKFLKRLDQENRKVLIFSQMTRVLDILEDYCWLRGWGPYEDLDRRRYCRLDGSVKLEDRQKQIEQFNDPASNKFLFMISTRAGGVGINLTAADTVIIFDSDWNPHMDSQAQDRYRFATAGTVEGHVLARANSKRSLERVMTGGLRKSAKVESEDTVNATNTNQSNNKKKQSIAESVLEMLLSDDIDVQKAKAKENRRKGLTDEEFEMICDREYVMRVDKEKKRRKEEMLASKDNKGKKTKKKANAVVSRKTPVNPKWPAECPMKGQGFQIVDHKDASSIGAMTHTSE